MEEKTGAILPYNNIQKKNFKHFKLIEPKDSSLKSLREILLYWYTHNSKISYHLLGKCQNQLYVVLISRS